MTLLAAITSSAGSGNDDPLISSFPIILSADFVLTPSAAAEAEDRSSTTIAVPLTYSGGLTSCDAALSSLASELARSLAGRKVKHGKFLTAVADFFRSAAATLSLPLPRSNSGSTSDFVTDAVKSLGFVLGRDLPAIIVEHCVGFDDCDAIIEAIFENKLLKGRRGNIDIVSKLVEKRKVRLLCLYVKSSGDLRSEEALAVMRYFLSPDEEGYALMAEVKSKWADSAIQAAGKVAQRKNYWQHTLGKDVALLLMMAHDKFSPAEVCLHYLFGSGNVDGLVLSSAIGSLDGTEVVRLMRYLTKWIQKYERFLEARPCPAARLELGIEECESVPPFESVVAAFGLVLDEHFSFLVWNKEIHEELRAAEAILSSLRTEVDLCAPVASVIYRLTLK